MTNDPNWNLPDVPTFELTSPEFTDGGALPQEARGGDAGGADRSPELAWSGAPEGTRSFVLTVYDPDAPTGSGFWHWSLSDIPASVTSLPQGAGTDDALLPEGATRRRNEFGTDTFLGAAPPAGHGPHRYFFTLSALDVPTLEVPAEATPAVVGFMLREHLLGRAQLVGIQETPAS
ncbi:YbhB/YbcL family Raf kinase inhibitor-like protein [Curtobacterium sp. MCPF17_047]|uniref:YbhB/YbcL family Raf kinase inhibitor-like protein n=1 Tax=Curtobacterium sp. MCPF17_047 TaxID=2175654 RepID=UPI000DA93242|nr:YbhB/YbcL family Raf kinase inhibitor-like protein [Curtobacterium sp. MCPF17_047]PZF64049.1 YbhB/YbcL family Raf kinase inhibitor-like protein [Curtobacterium sp. MCPF17_047]